MLHVETPKMTVGELARHIKANNEPVRRSPHPGNQASKDLVIMAAMPPGVDVMLVDTVQGSDKHSDPHTIKIGENVKTLRSRTSSENRVIGSLMAIDPNDGVERFLLDIHGRPLEQMALNNPPTLMLEFFSRYPLAFRVLMGVAANLGEVRRRVVEGGAIVPVNGTVNGIYGLDGPEGALVPVNGMMAMDMIVSSIEGSDSTTHLGGRDTTAFADDPVRKAKVGAIFGRTCAVLGLGNRDHLYRIVDVQGMNLTEHTSQHHLLESGDTIDIEPHLEKPTGLSSADRL